MWTLYNAAQGLKSMPTAYDECVEGESESKTASESVNANASANVTETARVRHQ